MNYQDRRLKASMSGPLHPMAKAFMAGSFSGTCSTFLFQPLDLLKTRVQQNIAEKPTMRRAALSIVEKERVTGLWRGVMPSLWRTVPGVGLYFSSMHGMKMAVCGASGSPPTASQSMLIGGAARCMAGVLTIPITVVKIRFESGVFQYASTFQALRSIFRGEGIAGLTSGLLPTLVRDVPFSGIYLMFYERLKVLAKYGMARHGQNNSFPLTKEAEPLVHFSCGILAGILASLVTQPADVIKTRQQLMSRQLVATAGGAASSTGRSSILDVTVQLAREEGFRGFFRGSVPRMMRRTMMAALAWTVYEKAMKNIGIK